MNNGGHGHVVAYLRQLDLSKFNPKAPPKTAAFHAIVAAAHAPEDGELADTLERLGNPAAVTLEHVLRAAEVNGMRRLADELSDRKNRRALPHKFERAGYISTPNPDAKDKLWKIGDKRQVVYARRELSVSQQIAAARVSPVDESVIRCPHSYARARFLMSLTSQTSLTVLWIADRKPRTLLTRLTELHGRALVAIDYGRSCAIHQPSERMPAAMAKAPIASPA